MTDLQKSGEKAHRSGEYIEVGPRGGKVSNPIQYTMEQGETLSPVRKRNKLKRISRKRES